MARSPTVLVPTLPTPLQPPLPQGATPVPTRAYRVAVRTLCEFTARHGDLDLRFTPAPTAQQGIAGHVEVTSRRPAGYEREVPLAGAYQHLRVRGRADGYDPQRNRLEEIKTHRGDVNKVPDNHRHLHWAQARVYAWLLCEARGLPGMEVALVYFDITRQTETVLTEQHDAARLKAHFEALCERFLAWADQDAAHRAARERGPDRPQVPARRLPRRTTHTGRVGVQGPPVRALPAGAGTHGNRQNGGHAVSRAQGNAGTTAGQALLPDRQDARAPACAGCTGAPAGGRIGASPARS